ncbi:hypothetical protein [Streptosporangium sandarakinum]
MGKMDIGETPSQCAIRVSNEPGAAQDVLGRLIRKLGFRGSRRRGSR